MPLGSSSEAPVISPGPSRPSSPLCAGAAGGAVAGDAGRQHGAHSGVGACVRHSTALPSVASDAACSPRRAERKPVAGQQRRRRAMPRHWAKIHGSSLSHLGATACASLSANAKQIRVFSTTRESIEWHRRR